MFKKGAAMWEPETRTSLRKFLGTEQQQTVYVGEQTGELMSLELIWREEPGTVTKASVYVDSQASLKALKSNKPVSGHQLADAIHEAHERVLAKHPGAEITFRWIAVHKDCPGNKAADQEAKLASDAEHNSPREDLPAMLQTQLKWSKSAMGMGIMKQLKAAASTTLRSSKQWEALQRIDPSMPST